MELAETTRGRYRSRPIADALGIGTTESMDVVTHVLLADGEPLLVSELWRPQRSPLDAGDVAPLLGLQAPRDGIEVRDESMLPAVATKQTCGALKLPDGAAVFSAEQLIEI